MNVEKFQTKIMVFEFLILRSLNSISNRWQTEEEFKNFLEFLRNFYELAKFCVILRHKNARSDEFMSSSINIRYRTNVQFRVFWEFFYQNWCSEKFWIIFFEISLVFICLCPTNVPKWPSSHIFVTRFWNVYRCGDLDTLRYDFVTTLVIRG